jgi:hypothetical protein
MIDTGAASRTLTSDLLKRLTDGIKKAGAKYLLDISATRLSLRDPVGFPSHSREWFSIIGFPVCSNLYVSRVSSPKAEYCQEKTVPLPYRNYVEGLEEDATAMLNYLGRDFIEPKKKKNPVLCGYSHGVIQPNYLIPLSF